MPLTPLKIFRFLGKKALTWLILGMLGSLSLVAFEVLMASFLQVFLKALGILPPELTISGPFSQFPNSLPLLVFALLSLGFIRALAQFLTAQGTAVATETVRERLSQIMAYDMLLSLKPLYSGPSAYMVMVGQTFVSAAQFCSMSAQVLSGAIQSLGLGIAMACIALPETIASFIGLVFLGAGWWSLSRHIKKRAQAIPLAYTAMILVMQRVANQVPLIKVLRKNKLEKEHLQLQAHILACNTIEVGSLNHALMTATPFFGIVLIVCILSLSLRVFHSEGVVLLSFFYMFTRFVQGASVFVHTIGQTLVYAPQFQKSLQYFFSFSETQREQAFHVGPKTELQPLALQSIPAPSIQGKNISFSYDGKLILKDVSFHIPAGQQWGIMGPSGSGKSTLLNLILGILEPEKGELLLGDQKPFDYLKSHDVGYVSAEPFLIQGSLEQNIQYGPYAYTHDQIWEALSWACLDQTVKELPLQLQTPLDESGEGLSLGQKQRLCLARALIYKPKLLILDEITANLDKHTQSQLVESLGRLKGQTTVIWVSHHRDALKQSDHILDLSL